MSQTEACMPVPPVASLVFTGFGGDERVARLFDASNLDRLEHTFASMPLLDRVVFVEMCRIVVEQAEAWHYREKREQQ